MIESIDNIIQLLMTGITAGIAICRAVRTRDRAWALLALFAGAFFLGDANWQLFLFFYQKTPSFYSVSDLAWNASYLFLLMLIIFITGENKSGSSDDSEYHVETAKSILNAHTLRWCVPAFTVGMCVFFMTHGDIINNVVVAVMMTGLLWHILDGLISINRNTEQQGRERMLHVVALIFCLAEYGLWISSCFWISDTLANPYFWFDFLLSITFILFVPAIEKGVGR